MKSTHFLIFIGLMLFALSIGEVEINPGAEIQTDNVTTTFNQTNTFDNITVDTNEIDFGYHNLTMNPDVHTDINIDTWDAGIQNFTIASDSPQADKYIISGFVPLATITLNGNSYKSDASGNIVISSFNDPHLYDIFNGVYVGGVFGSSNYPSSQAVMPNTTVGLASPISNAVSYTWFVNGVQLNDTTQDIQFTFTEPGTYNNVSVYATYEDGSVSEQTEFNIRVLRELATTYEPKLSTQHYNETKTALKQRDLDGWIKAQCGPYTDLIGNMFYLIVFGLPFAFIWLSQRKLTVAVTLYLIVGGVIQGYISEQFWFYGLLFAGLAITATLYKISEGYNQ